MQSEPWRTDVADEMEGACPQAGADADRIVPQAPRLQSAPLTEISASYTCSAVKRGHTNTSQQLMHLLCDGYYDIACAHCY